MTSLRDYAIELARRRSRADRFLPDIDGAGEREDYHSFREAFADRIFASIGPLVRRAGDLDIGEVRGFVADGPAPLPPANVDETMASRLAQAIALGHRSIQIREQFVGMGSVVPSLVARHGERLLVVETRDGSQSHPDTGLATFTVFSQAAKLLAKGCVFDAVWLGERFEAHDGQAADVVRLLRGANPDAVVYDRMRVGGSFAPAVEPDAILERRSDWSIEILTP